MCSWFVGRVRAVLVPSKFNVTSGLPVGRHKTIISLLTLCSLHLHNDFDRVKLHTPQSFHKKGLEKAVLASRVNIYRLKKYLDL